MVFSKNLVKIGANELNVFCNSNNLLDVYYSKNGKSCKKIIEYKNYSFNLSDIKQIINYDEVIPMGDIIIGRKNKKYELL